MILSKNLYTLKCSACSGKTPKLSKEDILTYLNKIKDWQVNDNSELIYKKFVFKGFIAAFKDLAPGLHIGVDGRPFLV